MAQATVSAVGRMERLLQAKVHKRAALLRWVTLLEFGDWDELPSL
jgi:hypothetical protein